MTRGDEDRKEGGLRKFLDTQKGGSDKIVGSGGGVELWKFVYFKANKERGAPKKLNR